MYHVVTLIVSGQKFPMYLEMSYADVMEFIQTIYAAALECGQRDFVITITPAYSGGPEDR